MIRQLLQRGRIRGSFVMVVVFSTIGIVLAIGLTLASVATFQYHFARESAARERARLVAEAGLSSALAQIARKSDFGAAGDTLRDTLANGDSFVVTFDRRLGLPYSTTNMQDVTSRAGYGGRVVPPYSVHIVAQGRLAPGLPEVTRTVECIAQFDSYPYAMSAAGRIQVNGKLRVDGNPVLDVPLLDTLSILGDISKASQDGSIYGGSSIRLGPGSVVTGQVRSPGRIQMEGSVAGGGKKEGVKPEDLPNVDITSFSTRDFADVKEMTPGFYAPTTDSDGNTVPLILRGAIYVTGSPGQDFTIRDAILQNVWIYVDGGVLFRAEGKTTGTGSIFTTGRATLEGNISIAAENGLAIFAQGDLEVGADRESKFQGVLYSHGNIRAKSGMHVVGSMICQSNMAGRGSIIIEDNVHITYLPEYTRFASPWVQQNVKGSNVNGDIPVMKILFWHAVP